jgi:hypothetical protein
LRGEIARKVRYNVRMSDQCDTSCTFLSGVRTVEEIARKIARKVRYYVRMSDQYDTSCTFLSEAFVTGSFSGFTPYADDMDVPVFLVIVLAGHDVQVQCRLGRSFFSVS